VPFVVSTSNCVMLTIQPEISIQCKEIRSMKGEGEGEAILVLNQAQSHQDVLARGGMEV
jgi:hypothetical protein